MKIQPEYINIHLLVVPNSTNVDDGFFLFCHYSSLSNKRRPTFISLKDFQQGFVNNWVPFSQF